MSCTWGWAMHSDRRLSRLVHSILLALTVAAPGASASAAGALVERTVAFVNQRPVLLSDVELAKALLRLGDSEAIERTIDESLMAEEASRLAIDAPTDEAIAGAVLTLREKAGTGFSAAALKRKAVVQLVISNYIDQRLRPLVRVEDATVRKAFNEMVADLPEPPVFSEVAPALRASLEGRALDAKIEEWVAGMRLRADIRRPVAPQ